MVEPVAATPQQRLTHVGTHASTQVGSITPFDNSIPQDIASATKKCVLSPTATLVEDDYTRKQLK